MVDIAHADFLRADITDPGQVDDPVFHDMVYWHAETRGEFSRHPEWCRRLLPHMQIHSVSEGDSRYFFCGLETTIADLFGRDFAVGALGRPGVPDTEFEGMLNRDYGGVRDNGMSICEHVTAPLDIYGTPYRVFFYRYVFPVRFDGITAVSVCARFSEPPRRIAGRGRNRRACP